MIKYNLRLAWRQMFRHPLFTSIHVLGLSIGICACVVIFLIARHDLGYDKFHPDGDRIYRIVGDMRFPDGSPMFLNSPFPQLAGLEHGIPGFEAQVGFHTWGQHIAVPGKPGEAPKEFSNSQEDSYASSTILTGPSFFNLFPHRWLAGSPSALDQPDKLVISESVAHRYFGDGPLEKMLGKTVIYDDSLPVTVAGIVDDWTRLSDLNYTSFISISTAPHSWIRNQFPTADWSSLQPHRSQAFVRLARGVNPEEVNARMNDLVRKAHLVMFPGASAPHLYLQSLYDIHYTPDFHPSDSGDDFRKAYLPLLYTLIGVAFFILLLALINFINLSTAQSLQRVKEVGIRRVMGSSRKGLTIQLLVETFLLSLCAVVVSALLVRPALWLFGDYIPPGIRFNPTDWGNISFLVVLLVFVTLAAGFYPARVLSSYRPVVSLKGAVASGREGLFGGSGLRKGLIIFQFSISLVFIIGSLIIARQVRYMRDSDKGFDSDAILTVNQWRSKPGQMALLAQTVSQLAGVKAVTVQSNAPMGFAHMGSNFIHEDKDGVKTLNVMVQGGDTAFIGVYGMKLLAGRNMRPGDSVKEVLINETYARTLGFSSPDEATGKLIYQQHQQGKVAFTIVGVVADFHQESFHETIKPLVIQHEADLEHSVAVKLATKGKQADAARAIIAAMGPVWKSQFPKDPFDYTFQSDLISRLYNQENNTAFLMGAAMILTIFVSCMGLFGLALYSAGRRAKEIGIRKVMGASVRQIALLLSRDFLVLVVIALVIAAPVSWWLGHRWLEDFAYRAVIGVWVFVEAGLAAVGLAVLTVGWQAVRAGRMNPVDTLRDE
ncbi:MAG TPA: ABC transporter permease [Puia sp.]|nr:ABC transporter permease [Puia sp.]